MSTIIYCHALLRRFADIRYENQPPPLRGAPRGVTLLLLAVNVHRTFTLSLTTLSGRTFPKNFVFLESNVC